MKTVTGWAIADADGIYQGWQHRRIDMIAEYVSNIDDALRKFAFNKLDPPQRKAWEARRRQGDKCVRVEIRELTRKRKRPQQ